MLKGQFLIFDNMTYQIQLVKALHDNDSVSGLGIIQNGWLRHRHSPY